MVVIRHMEPSWQSLRGKTVKQEGGSDRASAVKLCPVRTSLIELKQSGWKPFIAVQKMGNQAEA